ncbi:MAG TPA: RluA family pseudouridine synthase [Bacteroidales bacterium]|nr:RluA family pseudouridine synthase [Bacteroidales bacterium]
MHDETNDNQELYEHYRIEVDKGQTPVRIDKFLVNRLENISRTRIQLAAEAGNILVSQNPVKPNYKVRPKDIISIVLPHPPREIEILPENIPVNIIYEDDDLLVVNKEPGMVVHPGVGNYTGTLVNALMYYLRDNPLFQSGEVRPGLVHRIDKDTSGLLVVAKNEMAVNRLARQFFEKTTKRTYQALVWGNMEEDEGTITGNIGRNPKDRKKMYVFADESEGKHAVTHYSVLEHFDYVNLVECRLETGRTHQIRVHFQFIKHPLFNDSDYGGNQILKGTTFTKYRQFIQNCFSILPRQALHAKSLGFKHPATGKDMFFDSSLPPDMTEVLEKWRRYVSGRDPEE